MNSKRFLTRVAVTAAVLLAAVAFPKPATADLSVLSFSYSTLSGSFTPDLILPNAGKFLAEMTTDLNGADPGTLFTTGTVARLVDPMGQAIFAFSAGTFGFADILLDLDLTNISQVTNTAAAVGTLTATDIDGDTIIGTVSGFWTLNNGQAVFNGGISNFMFSNPTGTFDGQIGSFSSNFTLFPDLLGVVQDLTGTPGGFFDTGFDQVSSVLQSQSLPAPGAFLLGAMGLGLVGWVKRKFA